MSGEQRLLLAFEMSMFTRELAAAGIRRDHPEWTEAQVARELSSWLSSGDAAGWATLARLGTVAMSAPDVFRRITTGLDQASISYMLSGSFASAHYGVPRSTQDIDLVIEANPAELRAFVEALPAISDIESIQLCDSSPQRVDAVARWP